jgi:NADH-quinone oxidoreductase subunit M
MMLTLLIAIPLAGAALSWLAERRGAGLARWVALAALLLDLALAVLLWQRHGGQPGWLLQTDVPWIPRFGIRFHLGLDGLSLPLVALTAFLGVIAVACSWREITERVGFFHFNLLCTVAGALGVFLALDLFLFFSLWELMLVPMYFLIAVWGHENRRYASIKFFIFTQGSGLLMLLAILALVFARYRAAGALSFDYFDLAGLALDPAAARWIMLGFFLAFVVKLPAVPFHVWLPDAHTEAPTAGSVILAGVLLKTGGYGLLRFVLPLFPQAAHELAPLALALGAAGILYGALLAFAQTDLKRLVAYTSVSHLGFVLLGVFAWNQTALNGALMQMLAHGVSTGALFVLVGALQERLHTRDMGRMGGLWDAMPRMAGLGLFFAVASLGLPGLGNFVGEFLVLLGTFRVDRTLAVVAALGLIAAAVYALILVQKTFHGENAQGWRPADASPRESAILGVLAAAAIWLGVAPQPVFDAAGPALAAVRAQADRAALDGTGSGGADGEAGEWKRTHSARHPPYGAPEAIRPFARTGRSPFTRTRGEVR